MSAPTLQSGIDQAGSAVSLLWKPGSDPWMPEVVDPEYASWRAEQTAWHDGVALLNLSHHMADTVIEGPDATRLLSEVSANNYTSFELGRAKQFVPVTSRGLLIEDGILLREQENRYTLSGVSAAQNWVKYHGETGGHDVTFSTDPESRLRGGANPRIYRYQVQGPGARELAERAFGGPLPETKFFHSQLVSLQGRTVRAFRHGMAGQAGFEFVGPWADAEFVHEALLRAGEPLGLVRVGSMAYPTASLESGWIPTVVPAIYTDPDLAGYREWVGLYSFEGQKPLHGSFYSEDIEDYYVSPYELGYGKLLSFKHDFIGREALEKSREDIHRTKVTLVLDKDDVRATLGDGFVLSYARYRVEHKGDLLGMTYYAGSLDPVGTVLSLGIIDSARAEPGTQVELVWGEHPGAGTAPDADLGFPRIRATVQPAPFDQHARTQYRRDT
ncbi:aminomethyl transferase family protein [Amycolatopsis acidicola]|uniref:Aminomethyl transferase family protein n=1 Tax=Amycolatopsis acidicola TaxID=2596893 RepID=A0A5N0VNB7_9PSEU|nr:aminomethyltransferase family protein [Amycolatopsis acidicola]KAA9166131.1 aminomethyl transferase family protein [Amycolatopsis acidicola]